MSFAALLLLAAALAADAFAVSMVQGVKMRALRASHVFAVAASFGVFQGAMPVLGWLLGAQFGRFVVSIDHWVAFGLLGIIGAKMVKDALWPPADDVDESTPLNVRGLLILSFATSIDAFAVGLGLALVGSPIVLAAIVIAVVTFLLSVVGVFLGHRFGLRFRKVAEIVGGLVLIVLGTQILLEHLLG